MQLQDVTLDHDEEYVSMKLSDGSQTQVWKLLPTQASQLSVALIMQVNKYTSK